MHIGSGLNTVSSMYRQQKGNNMKAPVSAEKTFYTAETPKVYQIFTTDNMLWTGGNGTGLSYCLKYADDSTDENPVVLAKGVDENGKEFEQRIYIPDADIYCFDNGSIHLCEYEETESYQVTEMFINNRQMLLDKLLTE